MVRKFSKTQKDEMSTVQKNSWKDPTKRVEQKKRMKAKRLLKDKISDRIESPTPLHVENARQALIEEMKNLDEQLANFGPLVERRDKLSSILEELNNLRERK